MSRWIHSDGHCPRRPLFGRRDGRLYKCRCGRVWRYRITRGLVSSYVRWELVLTPKGRQ